MVQFLQHAAQRGQGHSPDWPKHPDITQFIVPFEQEDRLYELIKGAFTLITGKLHIIKPEASNGYQRHLERHKSS